MAAGDGLDALRRFVTPVHWSSLIELTAATKQGDAKSEPSEGCCSWNFTVAIGVYGIEEQSVLMKTETLLFSNEAEYETNAYIIKKQGRVKEPHTPWAPFVIPSRKTTK